MFQDPDNPNTYYFIGMVYFEVWSTSDGSWTNGKAPGMTVNVDGFDYEFQFNTNRKIKDITMQQFTYSDEYWLDIFSASRTGELGTNDLNYYQRATSNRNYAYSSQPFNASMGKGTNIGKMPVYVTGGYLGAQDPVNRKLEEENNGRVFASGVEGWRYFFPTLFKIVLEPQEGKAIIKHFTTTGQSLNGVDGFQDREEKLELNNTYHFTHATGTANYLYKGFKKSTVAAPSGGTITDNPPDPPGFMYDGTFPIYYVYFYYEGDDSNLPDPEPEDPPPTGVQCTNPSPGNSMSGEDFNPNVSAVIKADSRGNERFNVLQGIPTTESLYGQVWTKAYLYQYRYQEMAGSCTFNVNVRVLPPPPDPNEPLPPVTEPPPEGGEELLTGSVVQVTVEKDYSYWTVQDVQVFKINEAALWNYAFDGNGIRIQPSGYNSPYYAKAQTGGYEPDDIPDDITIPFDQSPEEAAESAVHVRVRNDTFTFYNQTLMSGSSTSNTGSAPLPIPEAPLTGDNVLYSPNHVIPMTKTNKANQSSSGTVYYEKVSGSGVRNYPIYGMNSITVHTPVVIYPNVSDDASHNQKTMPAIGRSAVILDRPFTVKMPNRGQHTHYTGYGHRNYLAYIGSKQIRFPFDVYDRTQTHFYPKSTWIEVDKTSESFDYFLPVWVDEGFYEVEFRTIAHNARTEASEQTHANLDAMHHIAYAAVPVDVIGRVYDFRITDIADYNWETVFRIKQGSTIPSGSVYWAGINGIDGIARGNSATFTLPVRPGSHPWYKNAVIKTGYHFKFDMKTKGNMFGTKDQVIITPTFYYMDVQGNERIPVDLYYHTSNTSYVKIGSALDKLERYVILNDRLRNVPLEQLTDTALYQYDHGLTFDQIANIGRSQFVQRYISYLSKQKTVIGSLSQLRLHEQTRTLAGPKDNIPTGVDRARANASIQQWYGEYSLPADLYAVRAGVNIAEYGRTHNGLSNRSPIFLKDGYIVVNFNMETVQNGEMSKPHLQYIHAPLMNQWWQMEGFQRYAAGPFGEIYPLMDGDVVFYDTNRSSRDDFRSMVTH